MGKSICFAFVCLIVVASARVARPISKHPAILQRPAPPPKAAVAPPPRALPAAPVPPAAPAAPRGAAPLPPAAPAAPRGAAPPAPANQGLLASFIAMFQQAPPALQQQVMGIVYNAFQ